MFLIALAPAMLALTGPASADGFTARIVTQPYYGAVTTLEHGVRVIRPLPPERYVIVNPNRTPLALSFNENNVYDYSSNATSSGGDLGVVDPDGPIYTRPSYGSIATAPGIFETATTAISPVVRAAKAAPALSERIERRRDTR